MASLGCVELVSVQLLGRMSSHHPVLCRWRRPDVHVYDDGASNGCSPEPANHQSSFLVLGVVQDYHHVFADHLANFIWNTAVDLQLEIRDILLRMIQTPFFCRLIGPIWRPCHTPLDYVYPGKHFRTIFKL